MSRRDGARNGATQHTRRPLSSVANLEKKAGHFFGSFELAGHFRRSRRHPLAPEGFSLDPGVRLQVSANETSRRVNPQKHRRSQLRGFGGTLTFRADSDAWSHAQIGAYTQLLRTSPITKARLAGH